MAQNGNNQNGNNGNGKNPFRKNPIITFLRLAILAGVAYAIVYGVKTLIGG